MKILDDEASAFVDSMEAVSLEQHCDFITHKAGNTLDLVMTETFSGLQIKACQAGDLHMQSLLSTKLDLNHKECHPT